MKTDHDPFYGSIPLYPDWILRAHDGIQWKMQKQMRDPKASHVYVRMLTCPMASQILGIVWILA